MDLAVVYVKTGAAWQIFYFGIGREGRWSVVAFKIVHTHQDAKANNGQKYEKYE